MVKQNKFIHTVTVTGADDSISPFDLVEISKKYPFVEFGILLSKFSLGSPRFPSSKWLYDLIYISKFVKDLKLSGHICGKWVQEILLGDWPSEEFKKISYNFQDIFSRWQINTHAQSYKVNENKFIEILKRLNYQKQNIIFQFDEVNDDLLFTSKRLGFKNISTLFDVSHGRGILPDKLQTPIFGVSCGYAGGLSPENIHQQIEEISKIVGNSKIWVDSETHLRSKDNLKFDLNRVEMFLKEAEPFVYRE